MADFTYLEVEAALCVWECINEWTIHDEKPREPWVTYRLTHGSVHMRHTSIALGQWCLKVYDLCVQDDPDFFDGVSYDWDVIPMILKNGSPDPALCLPPESIAPLVKAEHTKREWFCSAKQWAGTVYCYPGLVDDHADQFHAMQSAGLDAKDAVEQVGTKYDLIRSPTPSPSFRRVRKKNQQDRFHTHVETHRHPSLNR